MALGHGAAELDRDKNRMCLAHGRQFFISQKAAIASFFLRRFGRVIGLQRECRAKGEKLATNVMYRRICTLMMRTIKIYGVSVAFMAILIDLLRGKGK